MPRENFYGNALNILAKGITILPKENTMTNEREEQIYNKAEEIIDNYMEHMMNALLKTLTPDELKELKDKFHNQINLSVDAEEFRFEREWL